MEVRFEASKKRASIPSVGRPPAAHFSLSFACRNLRQEQQTARRPPEASERRKRVTTESDSLSNFPVKGILKADEPEILDATAVEETNEGAQSLAERMRVYFGGGSADDLFRLSQVR